MAKPSNVHRPTEAAAIGRLRPGRPAFLPHLYEHLAVTVRRHDQHGARLIRYQLLRAMAGGKVGEA
ncbi:hypothetical protein BX265_2318 [Streptomyces sp. TLI_235]|nr:hypothetical protein [Streptomyces sp. TLI_235]PBC77567.1 hypothetical protein BX265_2318 [Streptomyces sp. TLI_235]